jgi:hypothetical protein
MRYLLGLWEDQTVIEIHVHPPFPEIREWHAKHLIPAVFGCPDKFIVAGFER